MNEEERRDAQRRYRYSISPEDTARVPCYNALAQAFAENDTALELLSEVPLEQRNSMVIFAILHFLALEGDTTLAPLYAPLARGTADPQDFARRVVAYLSAYPELIRAQLHRTTQTNEVGRSAVLAAVLRELFRRGLARVNLLDVGTSAGLNLYLDHYPVSSVPVTDPLTLVCEQLNDADVPGPLPTIATRSGIDLNPLDLSRPDDAMWLSACIWPEDAERHARLALIEAALPTWEPTTLLRGGVLERLDDGLALGEDDTATVVMHTWAAAYFPPEIQAAFAQRMRSLVATTQTYWISIEWPRSTAAFGHPEPHHPEPRPGACQIVVAEPGGEPTDWGWCHAHGRWLALSADPGPKA